MEIFENCDSSILRSRWVCFRFDFGMKRVEKIRFDRANYEIHGISIKNFVFCCFRFLSGHDNAVSYVCDSLVARARNCRLRFVSELFAATTSSTSLSRGNKVDGLPRAASFDGNCLYRNWLWLLSWFYWQSCSFLLGDQVYW